jgi:hypothetical protein
MRTKRGTEMSITMTEVSTKQEQGLHAAMEIHDFRYPEGDLKWTLTFWGDLRVPVFMTLTSALRLEAASDAQGDDALWIIRHGWDF